MSLSGITTAGGFGGRRLGLVMREEQRAGGLCCLYEDDDRRPAKRRRNFLGDAERSTLGIEACELDGVYERPQIQRFRQPRLTLVVYSIVERRKNAEFGVLHGEEIPGTWPFSGTFPQERSRNVLGRKFPESSSSKKAPIVPLNPPVLLLFSAPRPPLRLSWC